MNFFKFLVLSSLAAVTAAAPAYCEEDEEGSGKVFNSIKKAITEKDRDLFIRTLRYPFETCFKNENKRFLNPGELEGYSLADLLGSEAMLDAYIKEIARLQVFLPASVIMNHRLLTIPARVYTRSIKPTVRQKCPNLNSVIIL